VQHGEFFGTDGVGVGLQISNGEWRRAHSRSDQEIHAIKDSSRGAANMVELAPALNVCGGCDVCSGAQPLQSRRPVQFGIPGNVILVIRVGFRSENSDVGIHPRIVAAPSR